MLQLGEASGVEMRGNYQLDARALPSATKISCQTGECIVVGIALPAGTLVPGTTHTLRIANLVAQSGPAIAPDPTTVTFTDPPRPSLERARSGDRGAAHLDRRHEADDRAHTVRAPPVAREPLWPEKVDA